MQRLLYENEDTEKVIDQIFKAALDDNHKNQAVAWKIIMDRVIPVSAFEKQQGRSAIEINITSMDIPKVIN